MIFYIVEKIAGAVSRSIQNRSISNPSITSYQTWPRCPAATFVNTTQQLEPGAKMIKKASNRGSDAPQPHEVRWCEPMDAYLCDSSIAVDIHFVPHILCCSNSGVAVTTHTDPWPHPAGNDEPPPSLRPVIPPQRAVHGHSAQCALCTVHVAHRVVCRLRSAMPTVHSSVQCAQCRTYCECTMQCKPHSAQCVTAWRIWVTAWCIRIHPQMSQTCPFAGLTSHHHASIQQAGHTNILVICQHPSNKSLCFGQNLLIHTSH